MKLKRILTLTAAAALTTALLTGCPWEQDDAASSEPSSSSSSPSRPSHDSDSGDDDSSAPPEQEETGPGYVEVKDETGKVTKYEVSNENGLRTWAQAVKENPAFDCTLTADFTVQGDWTPVGGGNIEKQYQGTFDGGGHTISNLKVADASTNSFGLFSYIGENGKVKNLNLVNVTVNISGGQAGGVAGTNKGTITGCTVSGSVTGESCVGGVAGKNSARITGCCFTGGSVTGENKNDTRAGGIVGIGRRAAVWAVNKKSAGQLTNSPPCAILTIETGAAGQTVAPPVRLKEVTACSGKLGRLLLFIYWPEKTG